MITLKKYTVDIKETWDQFVTEATNGIFIFKRNYMDYHQNRYKDQSLMAYENKKLIALLPAHRVQDMLCSHNGLTFGGFLIKRGLKLQKMEQLFRSLYAYLQAEGIRELYYKPIPQIYYGALNESDAFVLLNQGATQRTQKALTVITLGAPIKYSSLRKRCVKKAIQHNVQVQESQNLDVFIKMTEALLKEKYKTTMLHSYEELSKLYKTFPNNIRLYMASLEQRPLAGVLVYISENVVKTQYISSTREGRALGAIDIIINHLIHVYKSEKRYLDLGTSTEANSLQTNYDLHEFKEMFGGSTVIQKELVLEV